MVQSNASTVDSWLAEAEPARAPVLAEIRTLAVKHLGATTESMRYGMPSYTRPGEADAAFAFASQKNHIALYVSPRVHALHADALKGLDAGKSCIRFRRADQIDLDLVDRLLADTARLNETSC